VFSVIINLLALDLADNTFDATKKQESTCQTAETCIFQISSLTGVVYQQFLNQ